jgi:hypothetical protein
VTGNKSRAEMTLAEVEAAVGGLECNRLSEQLHLLDGDPHCAWTARKRGEWKLVRLNFDFARGGPLNLYP